MTPDEDISLGEVHRVQQRMERTLDTLVANLDARFNALANEVSTERHRVSNLLARESLSKDFMARAGRIFERIEQLEKEAARRSEIQTVAQRLEALEKQDVAENAVKDFKKYLFGGSILGALLVVLQIAQLWGDRA